MSKYTSQIISVFLTFFFLLINVTPVVAESSTSPSASVSSNKPQKAINKYADIKERVASKEAIIKAKLQAFKDKRKATLAEKINTNLNILSHTQATQMRKYLSIMNTILDKLEVRINKSTPDIKNPDAARTAIATARAAIASASSSVAAQEGKDYTIQFTSEANIKKDAKVQRDRLHADILAVRRTLINAKQKVADAIRIAKSGKEGSSNGTE